MTDLLKSSVLKYIAMDLCKYCKGVENKQDNPGFKCVVCLQLVHKKCLRSMGPPNALADDVFFKFTCMDCADDHKEFFVRSKMTWVNVVLLTLHHLSRQVHCVGNQGFFHYKIHIASFIDRNWHSLFGSTIRRKKNCHSTVASTLTRYKGQLFHSGSLALGERGWWRLCHNFSPALAAHIVVETAQDKPKGRELNALKRRLLTIKLKSMFYAKVHAMGYMSYVVMDNDMPISRVPAVKNQRMLVAAARAVSKSEQRRRVYNVQHRYTSTRDLAAPTSSQAPPPISSPSILSPPMSPPE